MVQNGTLRRFVADTTAAVTFSWAVGAANELLIVGLTPEQCLKSRAISTLNNLVLGRPYGWYRDRFYRVFNCDKENSLVKKLLTNTASFTSFWIPIYVGVLYTSGATEEQIGLGCTSVTAMSAFIGGPYGYYLDGVRRLFKVNK